MSTVLPNAIITDSRVVQRYYMETYGASSTYIAYGSDLPRRPAGPTLARLGLAPREYVLFVGRLVPENCAHHLVEAWRRLDTEMKCVIVGDASYAEDYKAELRRLAGDDARIVFTGYVFGEGYWELSSHAYLFVETSGVGGTHPALVEAMNFGNCVVVHNTPENLETVGAAGLWYDGRDGAQSLTPVLRTLLNAPPLVAAYRQSAVERATAVYSWEAVTDDYEALFRSILQGEVS
jgi:glycosyltransferase involved in cell wall biosynthesis